ncbi:hypothetical protein QBC38DRAFT_371644 [Podospora fimiseda]|uniref:DRBM domain-containing protein n=1 Tax=Podospora fimiseda TaxID=252190 RepID=A0AAN7BIY0_9PEZI|nr:hypothetical protein QBC38DRAFT_371644 [Podospora fimiseda]
MATLAPNKPQESQQDEVAIDFDAIRAWLTEQQRNPDREITPMQKRALQDLHRSLNKEEPPMGDLDWISLMEQYKNAHKAEGAFHIFHDTEAPLGKWTCIVKFRGHKDSDDVYTFPVGDPPAFAKKKDAKRYAAKCCIEWLMKERYMPMGGASVSFLKGTQGVRHFQPKILPVPEEDRGGARLGGGPVPTGKEYKMDVHDEDIPATKRVEEMCRRLGLVSPKYVVTPNLDNEAYFDGYADFAADAGRISTKETKVKFIYSRTFTRHAIAEKVLGILFEIEKKRKEICDEVAGEVLATFVSKK